MTEARLQILSDETTAISPSFAPNVVAEPEVTQVGFLRKIGQLASRTFEGRLAAVGSSVVAGLGVLAAPDISMAASTHKHSSNTPSLRQSPRMGSHSPRILNEIEAIVAKKNDQKPGTFGPKNYDIKTGILRTHGSKLAELLGVCNPANPAKPAGKSAIDGPNKIKLIDCHAPGDNLTAPGHATFTETHVDGKHDYRLEIIDLGDQIARSYGVSYHGNAYFIDASVGNDGPGTATIDFSKPSIKGSATDTRGTRNKKPVTEIKIRGSEFQIVK